MSSLASVPQSHTPFLSIRLLNIHRLESEWLQCTHLNGIKLEREEPQTDRERKRLLLYVSHGSETDPVPACEPRLSLALRGKQRRVRPLRSGGSLVSGPLPLLNHSNYLQRPRNVQEGLLSDHCRGVNHSKGLGGSANVSQLTRVQLLKKSTLSLKM